MKDINKKVLLVDDEPDLLFVLSRRLTNRGFVVDTANSIDDAFDLLKDSSYFAVFCDISMPGTKNGFDILDFVKAKEKCKKFYFITGHAEGSHLVERAVKMLGHEFILTKPLDFNILMGILES